MKRTIQHLAASITDAAGSAGIESERMPDDCGIVGAEAVIHLRDAQRCLRAAADALRLAIDQRQDLPKNEQGLVFDSDDAA